MKQDELADARRAAIHALCVAQAQSLISVETFELRLALLGEAPTRAAMEAIVADLDPGAASLPAIVPQALPAWPDEEVRPPPLRMQAVLSSNRRTGLLDIPPDVELKALFGELHLDLRDAGFMSADVHIEVDAFCGTILVTVPQGADVTNECSTFMGSVVIKVESYAGDGNGLHIRFSGSVVMGELKVRARLPTDLAPPRKGVAKWLAKAVSVGD